MPRFPISFLQRQGLEFLGWDSEILIDNLRAMITYTTIRQRDAEPPAMAVELRFLAAGPITVGLRCFRVASARSLV